MNKVPRYNPREGDPQRYARAQAQQDELRKQCAVPPVSFRRRKTA